MFYNNEPEHKAYILKEQDIVKIRNKEEYCIFNKYFELQPISCQYGNYVITKIKNVDI